MSYQDWASEREKRVSDRMQAELMRSVRIEGAAGDEHLKGGCFDCDCLWFGELTRPGIAEHRDDCPGHTTWLMEAPGA